MRVILLLLLSSFIFSGFSQEPVPYINFFEGPYATTDWTTYATTGTDDWEIGDPSGDFFNSAYSDDSCWVTTLIGDHAMNSTRYLETPEFDLTDTTVNYVLSFQHKRHSSHVTTKFSVEYSIDEGTTWNILYDADASSKNWQSITGWGVTGSPQYYWKEAMTALDWVQGNNTRFRFKCLTELGVGDGWIIDDFKIREEHYNVTASQGDTITNLNKYFADFELEYDFNFYNQYIENYSFQNEFYFSEDSILDGDDLFLGIDDIITNNSDLGLTKTFPLPEELAVGYYYLIYKLDALDILEESDEDDNVHYAVLEVDSIYEGSYKSSFDTLQSVWSINDISPEYLWTFGDANNWHVEDPRTGNNVAISPPNSYGATQYLESPYLDLSSTTNTTVCLWYRNSKWDDSPLSIGIQTALTDQPIVTNPIYVTGTSLPSPRLYTWDCYCRDISHIDGELSTKIRIYGNGNNIPSGLNETIIDDIYIGEAKPDVAIESWKDNRFTTTSDVDTLTYLLFNSGLVDLISTTTKFYWSTDSLMSDDDILLGSKIEPTLTDTSFSWEKFTYTKPTTAPGQYYIIYEADANGDVEEMREEDNSGYFKIYQNPLASLPYENNFETEVNDWRHTSTLGTDQWEWGVPSGENIDTAFSGTLAFVTNLDGAVMHNSRMHLYTPIFDLTELEHPVLEFDMSNINYGYGYGSWPYNMGNMMYSINGGATWEVLDTNSQSFKRMYYRMEYESISGKDRFPLSGGVSKGELLFGKRLNIFRTELEYQTRDYDENHHQVLDLAFLGGSKQVQFMFVHANFDSPMEGMMIDNFEITEARIDLKVFTEKSLMVDSDDDRIKAYFKVANDENYISDGTMVNIYTSQTTTPDPSDSLVAIVSIDKIRPYYKQLIIIDAPTPTDYGSFSYLRIEIDPENSVVESDETNNNHYLSLGMDSSQNYEYPIVFDFEEDYINGWTWYHDSIGYFHGQRFRHKSLISDPVINDESGEWFLDSFDQLGYSGTFSQYPIHFLEAPAFDFSSLADIQLSFDFICIGDNSPFGAGTQGGNFEYSIDGGITWALLTIAEDPDAENWYNLSEVASLFDEPGWGNILGTFTWSTAEFNLNFLSGESNVRFRFKFRSEQRASSSSPMGFRLDNFKVSGYQSDLLTDFHHVPVETELEEPYFTISYDIENNTDTDILISNTTFYWSEDSIYDDTDELLYDVPEIALENNSTITSIRNIYYPLPILQETYYLFYIIDANDDVLETNEENNIGSFKIGFDDTSHVDLITYPYLSHHNILSGTPYFYFEYDFENFGNYESPYTTTEFYWSTDTLFDELDILLYSFPEVSLPAFYAEYRSGEIYYPGPITQPDYYLLILVDQFDDVVESNETNNLTIVKVSFGDVGTDEYSDGGNIGYYFNNSELILINLKPEEISSRYGVVNPLGQLVYTGQFSSTNENATSVNLDRLSTGIYTLFIHESGRTVKFYYND